MKLKKYLNEDKAVQDAFAKKIKKDCDSWLKTIAPIIGTGKAFIRRMHNKNIPFLMKLTPRTDRRPLDSTKELHSAFDNAFKHKFGWRGRSEGVFSYPIEDYTQVDAYIYYFIYPVGKFEYIYSPEVKDLWIDAEDLWTVDSKSDPVKEFIDSYTNKNLLDVFKGRGNLFKCEVMFKCSQYYAVNNKYAKFLKENKLL